MNYIIYLLLILSVSIASCSHKVLDSKRYYQAHTKEIVELINDYSQTAKNEDFGLGYMNNSYTSYSIHFYKDSLRYIYSSGLNNQLIIDEIHHLDLDQPTIESFLLKIKQAKGLWLDKATLVFQNKVYQALTLSFKSKGVKFPFVPQKFYVLYFFTEDIPAEWQAELARTHDLELIDGNVYHRISSRFR